MKTIRGKLLIIYGLIFIAMASTVVSSYIAVDTQKQHLILTELLSKQKLLIERVTFTTNNISETGTVDTTRFLEKKDENIEIINGARHGVDFMLDAFTTLEYPLDGKIVRLKFGEDFLPIFEEAIKNTNYKWTSIQKEVDWLLDENNLDDIDIYKERLDSFQDINKEIINDSDYLTQICKEEADRKKNFSNWIQGVSMSISALIFLILIWFISNHFEKPINQIRKVFKNMAKGDFEERLTRKHDDEFRALFLDFNHFVDSLLSIRAIEDYILSEDHLSKNLSFIQQRFMSFAPYDRIHLYYEDAKGLKTKMSQGEDNTEYKIIDEILYYDEIKLIDKNNIVLPIQINGVYLGYARFESVSGFDKSAITFLKFLKDKLIFTFYKSLLFKDLLAIVTDGLADLAESRDPETRQHLIRMSSYSQLIAEQLSKNPKYSDQIDQVFIENIKLTAPMHDVGKVSIPDSILLKPGRLTDEEFEIMKTHTLEGGKVLNLINERFSRYNLTYFSMAADIALAHQEKFDGSGYPNHISQEEIPLAARISALADVFDALTSKRPYKEAFSLEESYKIIRNSIGSHFDPDVVKAFFENQEEIESVYKAYKEV